MQKLNKNTTLIKESELHAIVENIVRQKLQEDLINEVNLKKIGKKVGVGAAKAAGLGLGAAGLTYAAVQQPTPEERYEKSNREMGVHEFKKDSTGHVREIPVGKATPSDKKIHAESIHLTPSQFKQVIRESVCRILQEQGYHIGNQQMLDEASLWQNMKAAGKTATRHLPWHWKKYYNNYNANYDAQNADDIANKSYDTATGKAAEFQQRYNDAKNGVGRKKGWFGGKRESPDDVKNAWNTWYSNQMAKDNAKYNQSIRSMNKRRDAANAANTNGNANFDIQNPTAQAFDGNIDWDGKRLNAMNQASAQATAAADRRNLQASHLQQMQQQQQWEQQMEQQYGPNWKQMLQQFHQQQQGNPQQQQGNPQQQQGNPQQQQGNPQQQQGNPQQQQGNPQQTQQQNQQQAQGGAQGNNPANP